MSRVCEAAVEEVETVAAEEEEEEEGWWRGGGCTVCALVPSSLPTALHWGVLGF